MEPLSREEKKKIVRSELYLLGESHYITPRTFDKVLKAHERFYEDLAKREKQVSQAESVETKLLTPKPSQKLKPKIERPKKEKQAKTEEQIRERNITWLLNLGVILLLIGGLYVATSNWETMSSVTKAGSIGLISLLFYGIAMVSKRVLRIDKTAFAFMVLGSLFLPIFLLSIGWFELIGPYFSVYGEGRYIFGMLSSLIVLPVYVFLASRLYARLFVWFSYISLFIGLGFLLAAFHAGEDTFFLGMMLFQALFIYLYHRFKANGKYALFTKEFVYFAQLNLILTSVLMMFLFNSHAYLGFNLILTAGIYLAMVYVTGRKEFHFVFTAMIVYGVFQLVEFSILDHISALLYATVGFVFLLIPKVLNDEYPWKKIFTLTSGLVSALAFLLISVDAILIKLGEPTIVLLLSYFVISANFLYLSHTTKKRLFSYLTAIFMSVAFFEGLLLLDKWVELKPFVLFVFLIGIVMFMLGVYLKGSWMETVKQPARDVGWFYMGISFYGAFVMYSWWEAGVMLLLISLCAYLSLEKEPRVVFKSFGEWLVPLSLGLGVAAFGEEMREVSNFYRIHLGASFHFVLGGLVLLAAHFFTKDSLLRRNYLYTAQGFYTFALLCAVTFSINEVWIRPLIFMGGICMYLYFYVVTKRKFVAYLVSVTTLITYFVVLMSIDGFGELEYVVGAVLLFVAAWFVKNKDLATSFAMVGHLYLPFSLLLSLFTYGNDAIWSFGVALIIYGVSTSKVGQEWKKKTFLYSAFTSLFAVFATAIEHVENMEGAYSFLLTSILVAGFWLLADTAYKKRALYYLVPFSLLGVLAFLNLYPFGMVPFIVTLLYGISVMVFLHVVNWKIIGVIPTLFIYGATLQYLAYHTFAAENELLLLAVFGIVFLLAGKWFYKDLYEKPLSVDIYTCASILFFVTMYFFEQPFLWMKVLPGLLIAGAILLQRSRVAKEWQWIPIFVAGAYLLQPYYVCIQEYEVHYLLLREAYVLPLVGVGILLRRCLKGRHEKLTNYLQWAILSLVAVVLVVDGLETSTIYDALILGSLALASILAGVFLRIKSYFVIGTGVLLLNVFMQTRPFWGNLPWWAYLLIAGSILIGVASSNEWNKQKTSRGEKTLIEILKQKVLSMWRQWK